MERKDYGKMYTVATAIRMGLGLRISEWTGEDNSM